MRKLRSVPTKLGRYTIRDLLGRGGMADVYLATHADEAGFEHRVALKIPAPTSERERAELGAALLEEARLGAAVRHPLVVPVLEVVGGDEGALALALGYVDGQSLGRLVSRLRLRGGHLPTNVALAIARDALVALDAVHRAETPSGLPLGIVHRDVSPGNLLVGLDGLTRLADFGIACATLEGTPPRSSEVRGKIGYMAPERLRKQEHDARSDLFSLGIVLFELLVGRKLHTGKDDVELTRRALLSPVPRPSSERPELEPFDAVVGRALMRDPTRRFGGAAEMLEALERAAERGHGIANPLQVACAVATITAEEPERELDEDEAPTLPHSRTVLRHGAAPTDERATIVHRPR